MRILAKLICKVKGHRRGKRVGGTLLGGKPSFKCPRCEATWSRKDRKPKAAA